MLLVLLAFNIITTMDVLFTQTVLIGFDIEAPINGLLHASPHHAEFFN